MLLLKEWKKEKDTLHHLSQILGKYKLSSQFKEPQWGHVILNITTRGFSTGLLFVGKESYEIEVNLRDHRIEVTTNSNTKYIILEDGKTIKSYYEEIKKALQENKIEIEINKTPQETIDKTPFDEDIIHHHYNKDIMKDVVQWMHFAVKIESKFLSKYRTRKVKPGLFWGTFDISCLINYDKMHSSFDDSMIIESNAFDEHFIEFGFWFGDDNYQGPTFFILPHPFVDGDFQFDLELPEQSYFDKKLGEFVFEAIDNNDVTAKSLLEFLEKGYEVFKDYLGWKDTEYCNIPLKIEDNQLEKNCGF